MFEDALVEVFRPLRDMPLSNDVFEATRGRVKDLVERDYPSFRISYEPMSEALYGKVLVKSYSIYDRIKNLLAILMYAYSVPDGDYVVHFYEPTDRAEIIKLHYEQKPPYAVELTFDSNAYVVKTRIIYTFDTTFCDVEAPEPRYTGVLKRSVMQIPRVVAPFNLPVSGLLI